MLTTMKYLSNREDKINKYAVKEYSSAKKAHEPQNIQGRPSTKDLINYMDKNMILNCPVMRQDILRAEDIFGSNLGSLKGKMTCNTHEHVAIST